MSNTKKYPDNIVFNEETNKFDANLKHYPTTVGAQKFEILQVDKSDALKADKYFNKKLQEIKEEYDKLISEYESTRLIYNTKYNFQPTLGEVCYIYKKDDNENFLSIIKPNEWNKPCYGAYRLNTNGTWEEVDFKND